MPKFLVIRFSSIGDIVLTSPIVRRLKLQTGGEVHILTKQSFKGLWENNPYVDRIHTIQNKVGEVISTLESESFDEIIDLHNNLRSLQVKKALGIPSWSFPKLNFQKWILVNFKVDRLPDVHIVDRYMETVHHLGVIDDGDGLDFFLPVDTRDVTEDLPANFSGNYIGFVIGGQHEGKMLSEAKIARLCREFSRPVVLLGGPEDREKGNRIETHLGKDKVFNAAGQYSLMESAILVREASVILTHDTGLMHIASAFKKRVISLWGGTVPELGMYPYRPGEGSEILEVKHFMRPSSKLGSRKGIYRLWNFMDMIPDERIISAVQERKEI